jgi:RNA polymerase sigma-70 factor (ECF subfamily)
MQPPAVDEPVLLRKLRQDDETAFVSLFEKYWEPLYLSAYRRLHNREEAEDIVQEVLASIWQRRATLQPDANGSLKSYLFTALRYRIISFYASVKTERFQGEVLEKLLHIQDNDQSNLIISKELQQLINHELMNMPDNMKKAYHLTRHDHYSIREVARTLQLSEQTVKNLITASSGRLRAAVERYYANETAQPLITLIVLAVMTQECS